MGRRYQQEFAGRPIIPRMKDYRMACCDCGLVHIINFSVKAARNTSKGRFTLKPVRSKRRLQVVMIVHRDNRATAAMRRQKKP